MYYAFRVDGPWDPGAGHRFNAKKVLIRPFARGIAKHTFAPSPDAAQDTIGPALDGARCRVQPRSIVVLVAC